MAEPVYINVTIDPAVAPYVDGTLNAVEAACAAWEQLQPHLAAAFGTLADYWPHATTEVRAALLAASPRLARSVALRRRLENLLATMPALEGTDGN